MTYEQSALLSDGLPLLEGLSEPKWSYVSPHEGYLECACTGCTIPFQLLHWFVDWILVLES